MRKSIKAPNFGYNSQIELFKDIFFKIEKPVICMLSSQDLTDCMKAPITVWVSYFSHVLPKGKYPFWRLNPANIRIISPVAHGIIDNGTLKDRECYPTWEWSLWDKLVEEKKKDYVKFVKENQL